MNGSVSVFDRIYCMLRDMGRDAIINYIFKTYNINYGLVIYNIVTVNPVDVALSIVALKLGVNKVLLSLIIAFLL